MRVLVVDLHVKALGSFRRGRVHNFREVETELASRESGRVKAISDDQGVASDEIGVDELTRDLVTETAHNCAGRRNSINVLDFEVRGDVNLEVAALHNGPKVSRLSLDQELGTFLAS